MEFQVKLTRNAPLEIESAYLWFKNLNPAEDIVYILYVRHSAQASITFNPLDRS